MEAFSNFETTVDIPVSKQQSTKTRNIDNQVLVNQDLKGKWEAAKVEKERTSALIAVNEMVLHDLDRLINRAPKDLMLLMKEFDCLSLTGGFLAQVQRGVWSLEREYTAMKEGRIDQAKLIKVKESLDHMKRKLELLSHANETRKNALERRK